MRNRLLIPLVLCINSLWAGDSTSHYFISFKDKQNSLYSIDKPWEYLSVKSIDRRQKYGIEIDIQDLPVNSSYIQNIDFMRGTKVVQASRWLNGVEVILDKNANLEELQQLSFVSGIQFLGTIKKRSKQIAEDIDQTYYEKAKELAQLKSQVKDSSYTEAQYNKSYDQLNMIGVPELHRQGKMGNRVSIAVLDAGFFNAYKVPGMEDLLAKETVIRDFVDNDNSVWEDDAHGAKVLSFTKTFNPGEYIGSAPFADYMLLRTEIGSQEYPLEELKWVFAAEFADSLGADIIIASVGYHTFDDPALNHNYEQLDGKTTIIARGANKAKATGMAVVCSAGNEGGGKWRKIGTPADASGVIAIGACDQNGYRASFSSEGINNGKIKPDFIAPGQRVTIASHNGFYAGNGTSYATPLFGGALACLIEAFPLLRPDSLKTLLQQSSTHLNHTDTFVGYGLPDFGLTFQMQDPINRTTDYTQSGATAVISRYSTILFRSSKKQKIKVILYYPEKKKKKKTSSITYHVKSGEWIRDEQWFEVLYTETKKSRHKDALKFIVEIQTESGTFQRFLVRKPD
jgi:hypothetical protein